MSNMINLIANVIARYPEKEQQLEKVASISTHLTSDDGISIDCEMYDNNIVRFLIAGTRSNMTITYNTITWNLCRKPRNAKPWFTAWEQRNCYEIFDKADEIKKRI